jgi:octaprenyl-diphosphate synthase
MEQIVHLIEGDLQKLEDAIEKLLTTGIPFIKEVVSHIVRSGGKRIRPTLVILSSRMCGSNGDRHIPYAAIVEFLHTATLLHDDVIDNAQTRRGSRTANEIWGNEPSVLVGDFLFSKAFDLMIEDNNEKILKIMAKVTTGLAEGEIQELLKTADVGTTQEEYLDVISKKTAILLSAACEIGAILGRVSEKKRLALRNYGYHIGMAFQLTDDILDYVSNNTILGKNIGTDLKEGKVTLPLIQALKSANEEEKGRVQRVLNKPNLSRRDFDSIKGMIQKYGGINFTIDRSRKYVKDAKEFLEVFPSSPYKEALVELADYIVTRKT